MQLLNILPSANAVTTLALSGLGTGYTYGPGQSGIGATLTGNSNGTITSTYIDGISPAYLGMILLVIEETGANLPYNGLYILTQVGDASHPYILTRHPSMCTSPDFVGTIVPVDNEGATQANTTWISNGSPGFVVGTYPVVFTQISSPGGSNYNKVEVNGTILPPEAILNFPDGYFNGTDNPGVSTNITIGNALILGRIGGSLFISGN
jgi:hypothetical protein